MQQAALSLLSNARAPAARQFQGRRQGGPSRMAVRGRISKSIRNRRATQPPAHFQRNPVGCFSALLARPVSVQIWAPCSCSKNRQQAASSRLCDSRSGRRRFASNCPFWQIARKARNFVVNLQIIWRKNFPDIWYIVGSWKELCARIRHTR